MSGHTVSIDADLMRIETHGSFLAADAEKLFRRIGQLLRKYGAAYLLVDARGGFTMDNAMRRQIAHQARECPPTAVAIFGATMPQQSLLMLISSTVQILRAKRLPLRFASSEPEARAWLVSQRPAVSP